MKKLVEILLKPIRGAVRLGFKAARGARGLSLDRVTGGVCRVGEKVVAFVCGVGAAVEKAVIFTARLIKKAALAAFRFTCRVGEWVMKWSGRAAKLGVKGIMTVPKSIVRNFSYWAPAVAGAAVVVMLFSTNFYALALKVTVNGQTVGYVSSESDFSNVVSEVETSLGDSIGENYVMSSNPEYSFTIVNRQDVSSQDNHEKMYDGVYSIVCGEIGEHYGLYVDGVLVAASETQGALEKLLDEVKAPYVTGNENETVEFVASVQIRKGIYAPSYFYTDDEIRAKFSAATNPRYYVIQEDDYLSDISKRTGLTRAQLYALNPDLDETRLVPGKKINISRPEVYLGIKIVKTVSYSEEIAFDTVKVENSSMYKTQTKVKTEGQKGRKDIVAKVTYVDGAQVSKQIVSETVAKEPVNKEIYVGTKALPKRSSGGSTSPLAGTGVFIRPINGGYISCGFGGYSGHTGTDYTMSGAYGKPAYASAAGTVIYAGWSGGYGRLVKIRHTNGYETWYAHLSAFSVSAGQSVYQGQQVGSIGSSGNVTGPHLHFEIRINGTAVNAQRYVG